MMFKKWWFNLPLERRLAMFSNAIKNLDSFKGGKQYD